ncbi:MAG: hypothetical protein ACOYJO_07005 [Eubacterium sp.]|jgi:hypothetical protein
MEDKKPTLEEFKKMVYDYFTENYLNDDDGDATKYLSETESQKIIENRYKHPTSCYDENGNTYVSYKYTAASIAGCLADMY